MHHQILLQLLFLIHLISKNLDRQTDHHYLLAPPSLDIQDRSQLQTLARSPDPVLDHVHRDPP